MSLKNKKEKEMQAWPPNGVTLQDTFWYCFPDLTGGEDYV